MVAVGPEGETHDQTQDDVVDAEGEDLEAFAAEDGVEEEAAEGDLGTALVAEGVIDDDPNVASGDEVGDEVEAEDGAQFVPVPDGGAEEVVDGIVVLASGEGGGLPDFGRGARAGAEEPGDENVLEVSEGFLAEAGSERASRSTKEGIR